MRKRRAELADADAPQKASDGAPNASAGVFVRSSAKFWVHPARQVAVKCAVMEHLPIYVFGMAADPDADDDDELETLAGNRAMVSSVVANSDGMVVLFVNSVLDGCFVL